MATAKLVQGLWTALEPTKLLSDTKTGFVIGHLEANSCGPRSAGCCFVCIWNNVTEVRALALSLDLQTGPLYSLRLILLKSQYNLIYRMSQEDRPIFWEVMVSAILSKNVYMYMYLIPKSFRDRVISLYSSKIVDKKETLRTVSNTGIYCSSYRIGTVYLVLIHFRKFHRQRQCTLQLMWGHGVLLVCAVYSEIAISRKPFRIGHIYTIFCLEWPIILTFLCTWIIYECIFLCSRAVIVFTYTHR
jgi:hypothetical protein